MEKRKPTYDLEAFKSAFSIADKLRATGTAVRTAAAIGFDRAGIVATIQTMHRSQIHNGVQ